MFYRFIRSSRCSSERSSETAIAVGSNVFASVPTGGSSYRPSAKIESVEGLALDAEGRLCAAPSKEALTPPSTGELPTTNGAVQASIARRFVSDSRLALRLTFVTLVTATTVGLVFTGMTVATAVGLLLIGGLVAVVILRKTEQI